MDISIEPTSDMALVREIVTSEDIWARISDGVKSKDYYPSTDSTNQWLFVLNGDDIIGIIYVHCDTSCSLGVHPYLIKSQRKHSREMMREFYKWYLGSVPAKYVKINSVIPECFKSAINFAKKVGFTQEGVSRKSFINNTVLCDRIMLGITRKEVIEWAA